MNIMNEKTYSTPAATFTERAEDYVLEVVLPGIAKDEVELNLEGKTLTLKTASKVLVRGRKCAMVRRYSKLWRFF